MISPVVLNALGAWLEAQAHSLVLARAAAELPGIAAAIDPAGLRLTAHSLRDRAFGTRQRRRDPRLALFMRRGR